MSRSATPRFRDRREAILDGAARLFNRHGVKAGMLADLAHALGLAPNSLSYYYRRKEDLVADCLARSIEAMGEVADRAGAAPTLERRLHGFVGGYAALLADIAEGRHPALIVFSDLLTLRGARHAEIAGSYTQLFRRIRRLFDLPGRPRLDAAARNARAHLLLSTLSWARAWLPRYEASDYPRIANRLVDMLLDGLAATGHRPVPPAGARAARPEALGACTGAPTRVAYLRAATRLVNAHSYRGASVDRIAAELALTKGSFYHHHETKAELIAACFERTFAVVRAAQDEAMAATGCGMSRLTGVCHALLDFQLSGDGPLLRMTAWSGLPEALQDDVRRTMTRLGERFAALAVDGMADGSLRVVDASIAAQLINGMINAAAEIERWVPGIDEGNAFDLYAAPLFTGLSDSPAQGRECPDSDGAMSLPAEAAVGRRVAMQQDPALRDALELQGGRPKP